MRFGVSPGIGSVVLLLLGACAAVPEVAPGAELVPEGTADYALDLIPEPREAALEPRAARLPGSGSLSALAELRDLPGGSSEEFELTVSSGRGGGLSIVVAAADEAGRRWGFAALEQLVCEARGSRWVRLGRVRDRPAFPLRGSKRPLEWELGYRANLDYEARSPAGGPGSRRREIVAVLSPGGTLDATESGVEAAAVFFRDWHDRGARRFAIEFDDVAFGMTPDTRDRFGWYPAAISHYLRACRERLRRLDPEAVLYWLPQTYWTNHPMFAALARDVGLSGGLPPDLGLVLTGPEIISDDISRRTMERALRAFGLSETPVLIYDNRGREGDHGPLRGRDPALHLVADSVFGERGEALNRITRLDYSWNPEGYDPPRSHLLACREVVGAPAARHLTRLVLEQGSLTALESLHLYRETVRRLSPPARAPVPATPLLRRIWRDLGRAMKIGIVDSPRSSP